MTCFNLEKNYSDDDIHTLHPYYVESPSTPSSQFQYHSWWLYYYYCYYYVPVYYIMIDEFFSPPQ